MRIALMLVSLLGLAASSYAADLTPAEKRQLKAWNDELKDPAKSNSGTVKDKCGKEVPVSLDSALVTPFMEASASASGYCDEVLGALGGFCGDDIGKDEAKKVKKISCKLGKGDEPDFKLSATGELVFSFAPGQSNLGDKAKAFFDNGMKPKKAKK